MGPDIFKFITPYTAHPDPNGGVANAISGLGHWGDLQREDTREKDTVAHNAQVEQRLNQDLWLKGNNQFWGQRKDKAGIVAQYDALIAQGTDDGDAAAAAMAPEMKAYGIDLKPLDPTDATPGQPIQDWHAQVTAQPKPEDVITPPGTPAKPPKKGTIEADIAALPDTLPGDETPGAQPEPKGPIGGYKAPSRLLQKGMLQSQDQGALPSQAERQASEDAIASIGGQAQPVAPDGPVRTAPPLMRGGLPVPIPSNRAADDDLPPQRKGETSAAYAGRLSDVIRQREANAAYRPAPPPAGEPDQAPQPALPLAAKTEAPPKAEAPAQAPRQGKEAPAAAAQPASRQRPRYRVMIDGEDLGVVDPNPAHKAQEEAAARRGEGATAGIVQRYRSIMEGTTKGAKSVAEVEARVKQVMPEIEALINGEAALKIGMMKAGVAGAGHATQDFKAGQEVIQKVTEGREFKKTEDQLNALLSADKLLSSPDRTGVETQEVMNQIARARDSGALSEGDIKRVNGPQPLIQEIANWWYGKTEGDLSPEAISRLAGLVHQKLGIKIAEHEKNYRQALNLLHRVPTGGLLWESAVGEFEARFGNMPFYNPRDIYGGAPVSDRGGGGGGSKSVPYVSSLPPDKVNGGFMTPPAGGPPIPKVKVP